MDVTFRELLEECEAMMRKYVEWDREEILASDDARGAIGDLAIDVRSGLQFDSIDNASLVAMLTEKPELLDYEAQGIEGKSIRSAIIEGIGIYLRRHLIDAWYEEITDAKIVSGYGAPGKGFGM